MKVNRTRLHLALSKICGISIALTRVNVQINPQITQNTQVKTGSGPGGTPFPEVKTGAK